MLTNRQNCSLVNIKNFLRKDIDNWIRWGKKKDYLPSSIKCVLGDLYKSTNVFDNDQDEVVRARTFPVNSIEAERLESIVVSLSIKHRQAFVIYWLDKIAREGKVIYVHNRSDKWQAMKCSEAHYHRLVLAAHKDIARKLGMLGDLLLMGSA